MTIAKRERIALLKLITLVEQGDEDQSGMAEVELVQVGEPVIDPLLEWLHAARPSNSEAFVHLLVALGQPAADRLLPYLHSGQRPEYWYACKVLSLQSDRRAITPLLSHLSTTDDAYVRVWAAIALGNLGATEAIDALVQMLHEREFNLRAAASDALQAIGEPAVEALLRVLRDRDADHGWRRSSCYVLGGVAGGHVTRALMDRLRDPDEKLEIRIGAATGLRHRELHEAMTLLLTVVKNRNEPMQLRSTAVDSLRSWSKDRQVHSWAVSVVGDITEQPRVRQEAISILYGPDGADIDAFENVARIVATLDDAESDETDSEAKALRQTAIGLLHNFGEGRAIAPLIQVLNDQSDNMVKAALRTLGDCGDLRALKKLRETTASNKTRLPEQTLASYDRLRCWLAMPRTGLERTHETQMAEHATVRIYRRNSIRAVPKQDPFKTALTSSTRSSKRRVAPVVEEACAVYVQRHRKEYAIALLNLQPGDGSRLHAILQSEVLEEAKARVELLVTRQQQQRRHSEDVTSIRFRLRRARLRLKYIQRALKTLEADE